MNKYHKVNKPKEAQEEKGEEEIRLTATGSISSYVARAVKVYNELDKPKVVLTATGNTVAKAVQTAEVIKRRFKGIQQITSMSSQEIVDTYEPVEEGLEMVVDTRTLPCIRITLSKEALDTADKGYQPPIDESLDTDLDSETMTATKENPKQKPGGEKCGKTTRAEEEEPGEKEERAEELAGMTQEEAMNDSVEQINVEEFEGFAHKWEDADPAQKITQIEEFWSVYEENQSSKPNSEEMAKIQQAIEEQEERQWDGQQHDIHLAKMKSKIEQEERNKEAKREEEAIKEAMRLSIESEKERQQKQQRGEARGSKDGSPQMDISLIPEGLLELPEEISEVIEKRRLEAATKNMVQQMRRLNAINLEPGWPRGDGSECNRSLQRKGKAPEITDNEKREGTNKFAPPDSN